MSLHPRDEWLIWVCSVCGERGERHNVYFCRMKHEPSEMVPIFVQRKPFTEQRSAEIAERVRADRAREHPPREYRGVYDPAPAFESPDEPLPIRAQCLATTELKSGFPAPRVVCQSAVGHAGRHHDPVGFAWHDEEVDAA